MAQFTANSDWFDPYKNFKFRIKWDQGFGWVALTEKVVDWLQPVPEDCPQCGKKLEVQFAGINHSILPICSEPIAFILFLALIIGMRLGAEKFIF